MVSTDFYPTFLEAAGAMDFDRFFGYYHQVHAHDYYPDYLIDTGKKVPLSGNRGFYEGRPKGQAGA